MEVDAEAQAWLDQRFAGLLPTDFAENILFFCTLAVDPPVAFREVWWNFQKETVARVVPEAEDIETLDAFVFFCNPFEVSQVQALSTFVMAADTMGQNAPPMFLVVHTVTPGERSPRQTLDASGGKSVRNLLNAGLDGIIAEEHESFALALAVRAMVAKAAALSKSFNDMVNERHERGQYASYLKESIHSIMWDYLRTRIVPSLPPVDYELPSGALTELDGYRFDTVLGKGSAGTVYKCVDSMREPGSTYCEVMKVMDKANFKDISDLKSVKAMSEAFMLLSQEDMRHPNIVRLYQMYHSPTHLFFRMEYGGAENLYHRLVYRDKVREKQRPLSFASTVAIISQALAIIRHLHLRARICHRDMKPENLIVDEAGEGITMKLADFDLALIQNSSKQSMCRKHCGTIPFIAPEVLLGVHYCGMAADIWSIGIVFFEILCGVMSIEQLFNLSKFSITKGVDEESRKAIVQTIAGHFQDPGAAQLLMHNCKPELQRLLDSMIPLLVGMLTVNPRERWKTPACTEVLKLLPTDD